MEPAHAREPRLPAPAALLVPMCGARLQRAVRRKPEDVVAAHCAQKVEHLGRAVVAVTTDENGDVRPVLADAADRRSQHTSDFGASRSLARPDQRQDRLARVRFEDMDGLEAIPAGVRVEQGELLPAVDPVVGIVDV